MYENVVFLDKFVIDVVVSIVEKYLVLRVYVVIVWLLLKFVIIVLIIGVMKLEYFFMVISVLDFLFSDVEIMELEVCYLLYFVDGIIFLFLDMLFFFMLFLVIQNY